MHLFVFASENTCLCEYKWLLGGVQLDTEMQKGLENEM